MSAPSAEIPAGTRRESGLGVAGIAAGLMLIAGIFVWLWISRARDIDAKTFNDTISVIVKHRTDLDIVAERVGVKLGLPEDSLGAASAG